MLIGFALSAEVMSGTLYLFEFAYLDASTSHYLWFFPLFLLMCVVDFSSCCAYGFYFLVYMHAMLVHFNFSSWCSCVVCVAELVVVLDASISHHSGFLFNAFLVCFGVCACVTGMLMHIHVWLIMADLGFGS